MAVIKRTEFFGLPFKKEELAVGSEHRLEDPTSSRRVRVDAIVRVQEDPTTHKQLLVVAKDIFEPLGYFAPLPSDIYYEYEGKRRLGFGKRIVVK